MFPASVAETGHQHDERKETFQGEDEEVHPEEEVAGKQQRTCYKHIFTF